MLSRIACISKFELVRLFSTKSGLLTLAAFFILWIIILYFPINSAVEIIYSDGFADAANQIFGLLGLQALLEWPVPELAMYWLVATYTFPFFSLLLSSDQTCADRQRGTMRFIALRATRLDIIFGRFLGQVIILMILITLTVCASLLMASARESGLFVVGLIKAMHLFVELFVIVLPFIALMSFLNSITLSAKMALIGSVLFFTLIPLFINIFSYLLFPIDFILYIIPGMQIDSMLNLQTLSWQTYVIPLLQTIFFIILSSVIAKRSSL